MYYLAYNHALRDGAGAQVQRILSIFLIAHKYHFGYVHRPFITTEHGFDQRLLKRFNSLVEFSSHEECQEFDYTIEIIFFTREILNQLLQIRTNKKILLIVSNCPMIDHEPAILNDLYPVRFSWVVEELNDVIQIAFHIRRGDVTKTQIQERYVDISYYLDCIEALKTIFPQKSYEIHLFSQHNILSELKDVDPDILFHIDEDVVDSFKFLVNCDLLFSGYSSFSYSASMLRRKGIVLYKQFWHSFSPKALCIDSADDIVRYKDRILNCFF